MTAGSVLQLLSMKAKKLVTDLAGAGHFILFN